LDVEHPGGGEQVLQRRVGGMKGQGNERLEAVGFVLQRAQAQEVIGPIFVIFNMAVQHGGVRLQADLVRGSRRVQPLFAVDFVVADHAAHALIENLCASAGKGVETCILELAQRSFNRELGASGQECDLHHGKRFEMDLRKSLLQAGNQVQVILKRQIWVQAANDMKRQIWVQAANDMKFRDGLRVA